MQVHVLTQERAASLQALLNTDFGGDIVNIFIHVDYSPHSAPCSEIARSFNFSSGHVLYSRSETEKGLRNAWFDAWQPQPDERAIILEDDIELSVDWYKWLKSAWHNYKTRNYLAGISLQRQTLVPRKPHKQMEIVNHHYPFLYAYNKCRSQRCHLLWSTGTWRGVTFTNDVSRNQRSVRKG